ncbi:hypothetical protein GR160_09440 [Flavobacterium sp. Sd200]|uniref:hypothetical protein n=1 Tax=Flavobacterium sp. Sd200 TaxID=2692211 RepID=UPI00137045B7|nr:hypothetical protein [Flavobacterium sp. Sd200]MXN91451.1 hypothetical protein [Flavobacterium sp. Sd200]
MKKYLFVLFIISLITACHSDDYNNNNSFLPNYSFSVSIDMNLPQYTNLLYTANPVLINEAGAGINGVIVMNTGGGYVAFENSCPNQPITNCSMLQRTGIMAKCPCDDVEYSLFDGTTTADVRFPLKSYRIQITSPTSLRVYN